MKNWQSYKDKHSNIEGARASFELDCAKLFKAIYPNKNVRIVRANPGDEGVDILIGNIGFEPIIVIQCKFFLYEISNTQYKQIRESFKTAIESKEFKIKKWILCIPLDLDLKQNKWWIKWKIKKETQYSIDDNFIQLKDGTDLISLFKKHQLYDEVFQEENNILIKNIHQKLNPVFSNLEVENELKNASFHFSALKNYFGDNPHTHIPREEIKRIISWIKNRDFSLKKNVFILEGEKGLGKTVILKDVYDILLDEDINVLGLKADRYFAKNRFELERKIFSNKEISFDSIVEYHQRNGRYLIIIIDQIDALSQALSANREYIYTYSKLISDFSEHPNVKIIISTRTFDLNYDADLKVYNSNNYEILKVGKISPENVKSVLYAFNVENPSKNLIELLAVPNHLEIFCRIPLKEKLSSISITTLKELFDELWIQVILENQDKKLIEILYLLSSKMYEEQKIAIKNVFNNNFLKQLNFLKSNNLIVEEKNKLQFFHQTFYEYTFARQFVENNNSLSEYILQNNQSLYVRNVVKMVIDYLRDFKPKSYNSSLERLIKKPKYKFHLKSLAIASLGFVEEPTIGEKSIFLKYISNHILYLQVFTESIFSKGWLYFLLQKDIPLRLLKYKRHWVVQVLDFLKLTKFLPQKIQNKFNFEIQKFERTNSAKRMLVNNINSSTNIILEYFENSPDILNYTDFISNLLLEVQHWEDFRLLDLFEKFIPYNSKLASQGNFWYYEILGKIYVYHSDFVHEKVRPIIIDSFTSADFSSEFSYEQESLFKKMYDINKVDTFTFFFSCLEELISKSKFEEPYLKIKSPLYDSYYFSETSNNELTNLRDIFIVDLLTNHLKSKIQNIKFIKCFIEEVKNTNSTTILKILFDALNEKPELYRNEIFELIKIVYNKNGFNGYDSHFQYHLRKILSKIFPIFDKEQKGEIAKIILTIKSPYHTYGGNGKRRAYLGSSGKKMLMFLNAIPLNEIEKLKTLKKRRDELLRKFPENIYDTIKTGRSGGFVGPPLSDLIYEKMNFFSWEKSMIYFNRNYNSNRHFLKGGLTEHARKFNEIVKNQPLKYYALVEKIIEENKVEKDYMIAGLEGLIDAKFDVNKVLSNYNKLIRFDLNDFETLQLIWKASYIIKEKKVTDEIINFLIKSALSHSNPKENSEKKDAYNASLNNVRGAAINQIIDCYKQEEYEERIFSTIEKAIYDENFTVKVACLQNLALLNHLNIERAFKIFNQIVNTPDVELLKYSFWSAQYFRNKFYDLMTDYFNKIVSNENLHKNGSSIIILNWINGYENSEIYYQKLVQNSKTAKLESLRVAEANLFTKPIINKVSLKILSQFIDEIDDDFAHSYSTLILRKFKPDNFEEVYSFLQEYTNTILCSKEPKYLLDYLIKCSKIYPIKCLKLYKNIDLTPYPDIQKRGYFNQEPVQLILSIYSSLNNNFEDNNKQISETMNLFDEMLKNQKYRISANRAIQLLK